MDIEPFSFMTIFELSCWALITNIQMQETYELQLFPSLEGRGNASISGLLYLWMNYQSFQLFNVYQNTYSIYYLRDGLCNIGLYIPAQG